VKRITKAFPRERLIAASRSLILNVRNGSLTAHLRCKLRIGLTLVRFILAHARSRRVQLFAMAW
jgi:hypothetical protein